MAHLITFATDAFDPSGEPENPFNPIAGQSVLVWLRAGELGQTFRTTDPDAEDWGWYTEVTDGDASYTVGGICFEDQRDDGRWDWMIQVVNRRSLGDVLRRRNQMTADDPVTKTIEDCLRSDDRFVEVSVEYGR